MDRFNIIDERTGHCKTATHTYNVGSTDYINLANQKRPRAKKYEPIMWSEDRKDLDKNRLVVIYNEDELEMIKNYASYVKYNIKVIKLNNKYVVFQEGKKQLDRYEIKGGFEEIWLSIQQMI